MPLQYDNSIAPSYSETEFDLGGMDLNSNGADVLRLFVAGQTPAFFEGADGTILMNAIGVDIWGTADQFRYAYKNLSGNGTMVARVDSLYDSDPWAKAGVMIRETLEPGSTFAAVYLSSNNGVRYQARLTADVDAVSDTSVATAEQIALHEPVWVKIERVGNTFNGYYSSDGDNWTAMSWNPQTIDMANDVTIGLAVTSHNAAEATGTSFAAVGTTGSVSGNWQMAEIGVAQPTTGNAIEPVYVALEDTGGNVAVATHPDPGAAGLSAWQEWLIPYSDLAGINLNNVRMMYIGVGDRNNPSSGGVGTIFVDDVGYGSLYTGPADLTAPGDVVQGVPNDGDWPGAETPDLAVDDDVNTKYLHFKGATEPTGIQVTPSVGGTVVTGLTFTTANDAPERDPVAFELYGSKDSIDGPYTLIASGDIADFNQETAWERFTMTATMISFENLVAYAHYQVLFPAVRDAGSANSMQIAEVELIGVVSP